MEAKTLHLVLIGKYFDMIAAGIKPEEYRRLSWYFLRRLTTIGLFPMVARLEVENQLFLQTQDEFFADLKIEYKKYYSVTFQLGYAKNAKRMEIEFKGVKIKEGNPAWGAEPGVKYLRHTTR